MGFLQGEIAARKLPRPEQIALTEGACMIGAVFASVVGPFLYFFFSGGEMSAVEFFGIVGAALAAGVLVAIFVPVWEISMSAALLSTIFVAALYKESKKKTDL